MLSRRPADEGQITLLIVGYSAFALALLVAAIDVSAVFLARQALSSVADSAALAGAQGVDRSAVYAGGLGCGALPVDADLARDRAATAVTGELPQLRQAFRSVRPPSTSVQAGTVTVSLTGEARLPFGRVLGWLSPSLADGAVTVAVSSHARSAVVGC